MWVRGRCTKKQTKGNNFVLLVTQKARKRAKCPL